MDTYWLVVLLIALLSVDFIARLRSGQPTNARNPWTIPDTLIVLCSIAAVFCLGLAWRLYMGAPNTGGDTVLMWLPVVFLLLAGAIISSFLESWRSAGPAGGPIRDPYLLLETSLEPAEPSQIEYDRRKSLATKGFTLVASMLLGFGGAAFLLMLGPGGESNAFFATQRIHPTPTPTVQFALLGEEPQELFVPEGQVAEADGVSAEHSIDRELLDNNIDSTGNHDKDIGLNEVVDTANNSAVLLSLENTEDAVTTLTPGGGAQTQPILLAGNDQISEVRQDQSPDLSAIGGPVVETPLEAITDTAATGEQEPGEEGTLIVVPQYSVLVQAMLGVKARSNPSTEGDVLGVLTYQSKFRAIARTSDNRWIQVQLDDGSFAWITATAVDGLVYDSELSSFSLSELPQLDSQ